MVISSSKEYSHFIEIQIETNEGSQVRSILTLLKFKSKQTKVARGEKCSLQAYPIPQWWFTEENDIWGHFEH